VNALREQGYSAPTPIQAQAWPLALRGDDIVAVAKTGSGKTCGFLIPALVRIAENGPTPCIEQKGGGKDTRGPACPSALVIAPTRELVQQIAQEAEKFAPAVDARVLAVYGGVSKGEQVRDLKSGVDILIATPGRLHDFLKGDAAWDLPPSVLLDKVTYLVLDEADKMLDMGFEPDVRLIVKKCPDTGSSLTALAGQSRQTLFFTATWPKNVQRTAAQFTSKSAIQIRIGQGTGGNQLTANEGVTQKVLVIKESEKLEKLRQVISETLKPGQTAIVFAMRKQTCDLLEKELNWDPMSPLPPICGWCKALHGDKEQWEREATLDAFRSMTTSQKNTKKGVLVATDVAARGLDIPGVALIVVYDFGDSRAGEDSGVESYVHRIGRTSRGGNKEGKAITFFTEGDTGAASFVKLLREAKQEVPEALVELAKRSVPGSGKGFKKKAKGKGKGKGEGKGKGKGKGKDKGKGKGKGKSKGKGKGKDK